MKKIQLILIGLFLINGSIVYSQNTTIDSTLQKYKISLDNCDKELEFYKSQLKECDSSDSLKTVVFGNKINRLENQLKNKDKQIRKNSIRSFVYGGGVVAIMITIINLIR